MNASRPCRRWALLPLGVIAHVVDAIVATMTVYAVPTLMPAVIASATFLCELAYIPLLLGAREADLRIATFTWAVRKWAWGSWR